MQRTTQTDASKPAFKHYLPATPFTDGRQGPIERLLKAVFRRRGD